VHWLYTFKVVKSGFYDGHNSRKLCGFGVIEFAMITLRSYLVYKAQKLAMSGNPQSDQIQSPSRTPVYGGRM
jgi:hypothetical protein